MAGLPAVGDWVGLRDGRIHAVLPRRTAVTRRMPGTNAGEQVLAANVDLVVAVVAPGRDANPRRVERLLALAWESGAQPVVVLGRADLCPTGAPTSPPSWPPWPRSPPASGCWP